MPTIPAAMEPVRKHMAMAIWILAWPKQPSSPEPKTRRPNTNRGLAANLGLVQLGQAASALTEALRGSDMQRASALYPETAAAYREACAAIGDLDTDA